MKKTSIFFIFFFLANLSIAQTVGLYEVDITSSQPNWTVNGGDVITVNRTLANCLPNFGSSCSDINYVNYGIEVLLDDGTNQYELLPITFNYIEGVNCPNTQSWYQPMLDDLDMTVPCNVPSGSYMLKVVCHGVFSDMFNSNSPVTPSTVHVMADGTTMINAVTSGLVVSADIANVSVTNSPQYISDITFSTSNSTCADLSTGSATANIVEVGGTGTYTYLWSNGQTGPTASGLSSGTYTVVVTDVNSGCPVGSAEFNSAAQVGNDYTVNAALSAIHICGGNPGQVSATATSGVAPYDYVWSTGATTTSISVTSGGSYSVEVEDANGCTATNDVDIVESEYPTLSLRETIRTCNKYYQLCGYADEDPNGNYTYQWTYYDQAQQVMVIVANTPCITPVTTSGYGYYTVKVTNEYGCTSMHTVNVLPGKGCDGADPGGSSGLITTVHPNPVGAGETFKVEMNSESEPVTLEIIDIMTGKIVFTTELTKDQPVEHAISNFETGNAPSVYFLKMYNDKDLVIERLIVK